MQNKKNFPPAGASGSWTSEGPAWQERFSPQEDAKIFSLEEGMSAFEWSLPLLLNI